MPYRQTRHNHNLISFNLTGSIMLSYRPCSLEESTDKIGCLRTSPVSELEVFQQCSKSTAASQRHQQPDGGMSTAWLQVVGGSARTSRPGWREALKHTQVLRLDMMSSMPPSLEACTHVDCERRCQCNASDRHLCSSKAWRQLIDQQ